MVGMSRARFYQLIGSAFPPPVYDVSTRRPFYVEEMQTMCLEVRRRNCGIDGHPILFYCRRPAINTPKKKSSPKTNSHADLIETLKGLGLVTTAAQVEAVLKDIFPKGTQNVAPGEVVRAIFIKLKSS
ncbi:MAG: hypothetical protein JWN70_3638 [Planctomycetaceae bacterium]|nr:hypothetical protein [Planctomycetaceae bacterium]